MLHLHHLLCASSCLVGQGWERAWNIHCIGLSNKNQEIKWFKTSTIQTGASDFSAGFPGRHPVLEMIKGIKGRRLIKMIKVQDLLNDWDLLSKPAPTPGFRFPFFAACDCEVKASHRQIPSSWKWIWPSVREIAWNSKIWDNGGTQNWRPWETSKSHQIISNLFKLRIWVSSWLFECALTSQISSTMS